jgi:hypothetical protein
VSGELWAVHGGGFYNPQKYLVAPAELPEELHWFKWEAYSTWLTGIAMLTIAYYFNASAMMVDKSVANLSGFEAVGVGIGTLVAGWIVYDLLCRSPLGKREGLLGLVMFVFIVAVAFMLTHLLSGPRRLHPRGRHDRHHHGGQCADGDHSRPAQAGGGHESRPCADPIHGRRGKQRSVHNNYFTLPVLFIMISNHYAMTYPMRIAGWCWRHHGGRRADPPLLQPASQGPVSVALSDRRRDPAAGGGHGHRTASGGTGGAGGSGRPGGCFGASQRTGRGGSDDSRLHPHPGHHYPALRHLPLGQADPGRLRHRTGRHDAADPELIHQHAAKVFQRGPDRDMPHWPT